VKINNHNGVASPFCGGIFFLAGTVRSGSTFLRLMLNSHPGITNPGECDFLFDVVDDEGRYPSIDAYHHFLSTNRIFLAKHLNVDPGLPYPVLVSSFIEQFGQDHSKLVMNIHRHFHRVPYVLPDARYIHLLRDPRDVARSCMGMGWAGNVYYGVDIWIDAERSWDKLKQTLRDDQYLEIKYEELLEDVEVGLGRICRFLGLAYSSQMLDYAKSSTYDKPDKSLSYQWKKKFSQHELALVEDKVGDLLVARGYELSGYTPVKPGLIERLALNYENRKYRVRHQLKRYGIRLYVMNRIANKFGLRSMREACIARMNKIDLNYLK